MTTTQLVLECLRVILTWPVLIFLIVIIFRKNIFGLLQSIVRITFPGGEVQTAGYNPQLSKRKANPEVSSPALDTSKKVEVLERDFNNFILAELEANKNILDNITKALMVKHGVDLFHANAAPSLKQQMLFDRIDKQAVEDFKEIESVLIKDSLSREELMKAYIKSKLLVDYFRSLATRR